MRKIIKIETISLLDYANGIDGTPDGEMEINGILRGGFISADNFYFTAGVSHGCQKVTFEGEN